MNRSIPTVSDNSATFSASAAVQRDPLLEAIEKYRRDLAAFDAAPEFGGALEAEWLAFVRLDPLPPATTAAGAAAALRQVLDEDASVSEFCHRLVRCALAYIEGETGVRQ